MGFLGGPHLFLLAYFPEVSDLRDSAVVVMAIERAERGGVTDLLQRWGMLSALMSCECGKEW